MPIERVRRLAPGLGVGVSTHTIEQLDAALAARPAYVAFGPVFETSTKLNPDPVVGVGALAEAHAHALAAGIPLVAVGGITLPRAREIAGLVEAAAVVSGLLPPVVLFGGLSRSTTCFGKSRAERARFRSSSLRGFPR